MRNLFLLFTLILFTACNWFEIPEEDLEKEIDGQETPLSISQLEIPANFQFNTTLEVSLKISAVNNQGDLLKQVPFTLYEQRGESMSTLLTGSTGNSASFETSFLVGTISENLILSTGYPGIPDRYEIPVQAGKIEVRMGDPNEPVVVQGIAPAPGTNPRELRQSLVTLRNAGYNYMGSYDTQGVPNYLEAENDAISQELLNLVANSLPEGQPVPDYNPQYISSSVDASTNLKDEADVWITFVHEGAGYRNALGYFTYPTSSPPSTPEEISDLNIIFPNVSYAGSGGGLMSGNKVYLGKFPAGTSIGWFLIPNGWSSTGQIVEPQQNKPIKYSASNLNSFTSEAFREHTALLKSENDEILLLGFEDISRPGGDKDFNDAIFFISANPYTAIQTEGVAEVQLTSEDTDADGVPNTNDLFIDDPQIAFANYSPAKGQFGSLAFEDQWPKKGDYDMNDMVLDYNFIEYRNADNKTIKLRGTFVLHAMGAGFQNGFGMQLDLANSQVSNATGSLILDDFIDLDNRGLETGQSKATIIVFDNGHRFMRNPNGGFVNTEPGQPRIDSDTIQIDITLQSPVISSSLGVPPYNPFLIQNRQRGVEVHLLNGSPTDKATLSLFGTSDDRSNTEQGIYYRSQNGMPWGINLARPFDWPVEKAPVNQAYLKFNDWAESGGFYFSDWYMEQSNFRNGVKIY